MCAYTGREGNRKRGEQEERGTGREGNRKRGEQEERCKENKGVNVWLKK
jgi:hypothetical protein